MAKLVFTKDLLTGHDEVDRQHGALFDWGNRVLDGVGTLDDRELLRVINFLGTYVAYHFASEEVVMRRHGYPRMEAHLVQHEALRAEVRHTRGLVENGAPASELTARVDGLFRQWYGEHIRQWDTALEEFLHRVQPAEEASRLPSLEELMNTDVAELKPSDFSVLKNLIVERIAARL